MQTLSMAGVAELAGVQRPVVSMWRSRSASTDRPFPAPLTDDPLTFDADKVAHWLAETGRGKNRQAVADVALHSNTLEAIMADPADASALLLLHHLRGEALMEAQFQDVALEMVEGSANLLLGVQTAAKAFRDAELRGRVDELAEAAFGAQGVLNRMVEHVMHGPWSREALAPELSNLLVGIMRELAGLGRYCFVPRGPGGLLMAATYARETDDSVVRWGARPEDLEDNWSLAVWRYVASAGSAPVPHGPSGHRPTVYLQQLVGAAAEQEFFERVEDAVLDLSPEDVLLLVGPEEWMTGHAGGSGRRELFRPESNSGSSLRYVARLPQSLAIYGGRRRLALWVMGGKRSDWTVLGAHGDTNLRAAAGLIAADVAVSVDPNVSLHTHAFHRSEVVDAKKALLRDVLVRPAVPRSPVTGAERLANIWELEAAVAPDGPGGDRLLRGITIAASEATPHALTLEAASKKLMRDLPGARISPEHMGPLRTGCAVVLGEDEIRDPACRGERGIDRLILEAVAPRARLTEPGDVVYVATGAPRAMVDREGGHVVPFPARVLRCRASSTGGPQLVPHMVAQDINAQVSADRKNWPLRTAAVDQVEGLVEAVSRVEQRRATLAEQLRALDRLENELLAGTADGVLTVGAHQSVSREDME